MKGKTWTGLANSEEQFADNFVGKRIQPFWIEDEARKISGTNFVVGYAAIAAYFVFQRSARRSPSASDP